MTAETRPSLKRYESIGANEQDASSYFLLPRRKAKQTSEESSVSPMFVGNAGFRSYQKSGDSNRSSGNANQYLVESPASMASKYRKGMTGRTASRGEKSTGSKASSIEPLLRDAIEPPRPAKEGFEWVWFPEGYWAERERRDSPNSRKQRPKWFSRSSQKLPIRRSQSQDVVSLSTKESPDREPRNKLIRLRTGDLRGSSLGSTTDVQQASDVQETAALPVESKYRHRMLFCNLQKTPPKNPQLTSTTEPEGFYDKAKKGIAVHGMFKVKMVRDQQPDCPKYSDHL